jgi:CarD family transcriptional regulator
MAKLSPTYSLGDKVVHRSYGIGKIDAVECKPLNGVQVECFKVKTENGDYWFPTDSLDNPRIRPVASKELVQKAIETLRSAPQGLENDQREWQEQINNVQTDGDFLAISGLVRDLSVLKAKKKLNRTQDQALKTLENRLLREWAASSEVEVNSIRPKFQAYIKESKDNIREGNDYETESTIKTG